MKKAFVYIAFILIISGININAQPVYETSWKKDGVIGGAAAANLTLSFILYNNVESLSQIEINSADPHKLNWFDRSTTYNWSPDAAKASDYLLYVCLVSPMAFLTAGETRDDFGKISLMYIETLMSALSLPLYAKAIVQRPRPYIYNSSAPDDYKFSRDARRSFFSGHAAMSFASAVFISSVYANYFPSSGFKPYLWGISLITAAGVSYLRYQSGMHFPTDIITGAVAGGLVAYVITQLHKSGSIDSGTAPAPANYAVQFSFPL